MISTHNRFVLITTAIALAACMQDEATICGHDAAGALITNVVVIDGSGSRAVRANVRISDGLIAGVGDLAACEGDIVVDGGGQALAPGFIDTHSHVNADIFEFPDALPVLSQGITTAVVGQDGGSSLPLGDFFARLEAEPPSINFASYAGHGRIRREVLGDDFKRVATEKEILAMSDILARELRSGALGLSTGLEYEPGIHSATSEVLALAHVAADAGGRYISHVRSEDRWFENAIDELILIGRETRMPVQISHVKLAMKRLLGSADTLIEKLDKARAEGVLVSADIYPYEYWQSTMMVLLPSRDFNNREEIAVALNEVSPPEGIWFTQFDPNPDYVGKTLSEIAGIREVDVITAFSQLAEEADRMEAETGQGSEAIIGTSMLDADVAKLLLWSESNICTDGGIVDLHPRKAGAFTRVLGRYVREQELLSLEKAVHKMTGLAAQHMGFTDRGLIEEGWVADLVLFDPETVIDRATPGQPELLSAGISSVWVSGALAYDGEKATGSRTGRVIRRAAATP